MVFKVILNVSDAIQECLELEMDTRVFDAIQECLKLEMETRIFDAIQECLELEMETRIFDAIQECLELDSNPDTVATDRIQEYKDSRVAETSQPSRNLVFQQPL